MFMAPSFSSPAVPQVMKYDVFLSFRGEDTRNNFTSHVYGALCRKNINTFIDNEEVKGGDEISRTLLNAIKASKISVIIFSKDYAASRWCLEELEQILDCKETNKQIVIPVFYQVYPSDVRHQEGKFRYAFAKLQQRRRRNRSSDKLKRWKTALNTAANLSGFHINGNKTDEEFVNDIVRDIWHRLRKLPFSFYEDLVGIKSSTKDVKSLLQNGSDGVHIIGIWGISGIGKTTIARAIYEQIRHQFKDSCFVENVKEEWEKSPGPIDNLKKGVKVLIIFDDVTHFDQIKKLISGVRCLGPGSQIIVTTRDKNVLENCEVDDFHTYKVRGLCHRDAMQLFCKNAFGQICPPADFTKLSNKFLTYAKGVPLGLKVLGCFLRGKTKNDWESKLEKLENSLDGDIQKVLKTGYDVLDNEEKNIFLDIACFFKGWETYIVKDILDASGFSTHIGLSRLIDKCLITISISDNTITMHDLLQEMGREIVRQESDNQGKRSRLWHHVDICNVLEKGKGKEHIRGICLDVSKINSINLAPHAFLKMQNLRFFRVYGCRENNYQIKLHGFEELSFFSTKVFIWEYYPFKSLPPKFQVEDLVRLDMPNSNVEQLWNVVQDLVNLKYIDLSCSKHLRGVPNLSKAKNLQELNLRDCKSIMYLSDDIQSKSITLSGCLNLRKAPKISCKVEKLDLSGTAIKESPVIENQSRLVTLDLSNCSWLKSLSSEICKCKYLEYLSVSGCSKLDRLPEELGNLKALKTLVASGIGLRNVPSSILNLSKLSSLSLSRYSNQGPLEGLPNSLYDLSSLEYLGLANCQLTEVPDGLGQLSSLRELNLSGNNFESIPINIRDLTNLCYLDISHCKSLNAIPELPSGINVDACNCSSLTSISELQLQVSSSMSRRQRINIANCFGLKLQRLIHKESSDKIFNNVCYSGNQIPEWFDFKDEGSQMHRISEKHLIRKNLQGFNICVVGEVRFGKRHEISCSFCITGRDNETGFTCTISGQSDHESYHPWPAMADKGIPDYVFMDFVHISEKDFHSENDENAATNNNVRVDVKLSCRGLNIKRCGIHFVYGGFWDPPHPRSYFEEVSLWPEMNSTETYRRNFLSLKEEEEPYYIDSLFPRSEEEDESYYIEAYSQSRFDEEEQEEE